jgi:hypothetical protein
MLGEQLNRGIVVSEVIRKVLVEAINDEYKARATYSLVIEKFGEVRPFINIIEAENRHIDALLPLFEKYDVPIPHDDWAARIEVPESIREACKVGVEAEIENGEMYDRLLKLSESYPDILHVLKQLQRASIENHLPAFQRCVEKGGGQGRGRQRRRGYNG